MEYKVPFVDFPALFRSLHDPVMATIEKVLSSGNLILRQEVEDFENHLAEFVGTKYAVGVGSGSDALFLTLRAIGFEPTDEIITVSHTCIATVSAIVNAGATPVLVDVTDDYTMDVDALESAITSRTRAVVPVHLDGCPCNMERILEIANRHGLIVIEDVAQALGAKFDGRHLGSIGLAGCFSLYPFKMLGAFGDAGMVTTDDEALVRRLRYLRSYGRDRETGEYPAFGFNSRLDNLQAAILDVQLPHLPGWIKRRREIARMYTDGLSSIPDLILPRLLDSRYFHVYLNYIIRTEWRDALREHLAARGVETLISLAKPIHHHPALKLTHYNLPKTDEIASTYLCLPTYPTLSDAQISYVIESIRAFFE